MATRDVLAVPLDEVMRQFATNSRQDVKLVAPRRYPGEEPLEGDLWRHSAEGAPNRLVECAEFAHEPPQNAVGPFAVSFANERAAQEPHLHPGHGEIYFSSHAIRASYRTGAGERRDVDLPNGGLLIFAPGVPHRVELGGLTMVVEVPGVPGDKVSCQVP